MADSLTGWNKPAGDADTAAQSLVVVMFTDIVGSTALGQAHGDAEAMELLRAHNRIVRSALTKFGGGEVKHTGDGIMASFSVVANAVQAANKIQADISDYAASHPEPEFKVRIGINAGETVVTQVVSELCQGKDIGFDEIGDVALKGFEEPVPIYRVAS